MSDTSDTKRLGAADDKSDAEAPTLQHDQQQVQQQQEQAATTTTLVASTESSSSPDLEKHAKEHTHASSTAAPTTESVADLPPAAADDGLGKAEGGDSDKDKDGDGSGSAAKQSSGTTTSTAAGDVNGTKPASVRSNKSSRMGFLSTILRKLIPCIGPSSAHDLDLDDLKPPRSTGSKQATAKTTTTAGATDSQKEAAAAAKDSEQAQSKEGISANGTTTDERGTTADNASAVAESSTTTKVVPPSSTGSEPPPLADSLFSPAGPGLNRPDGTTATGTGPGSTHVDTEEVDDDESFEDEGENAHEVHSEYGHALELELSEEEEEQRLINQGGAGFPIGADGVPRPLLPPQLPQNEGRKCLVLDMDETLLHGSFKVIPRADFIIPVEIEQQYHNVYVIKRPGVDAFLQRMGEIYEVVVFTASLSKYADPVLDKLDTTRAISHRLFRESCYFHRGTYIKDLSQLGRPIESTIILDNAPHSYLFQPRNAVPVSSWFDDPHDTELPDLSPFLTDLNTTDDVRGILDARLFEISAPLEVQLGNPE